MKEIPLRRLQAGRDVAETCVQFGFCTSVCPTYVLDGEENDSPRGRIALMRDMLETSSVPSQETILHVDRCLSCLSCTTTCAASVDYRNLVDTAREYIERSGARSLPERWWRQALLRLLLSPAALRLGLKASRLAPAWARRRPGRLGAMLRLANSPAINALSRPGQARRALPQATLAAPGKPASASPGELPRAVVLWAGCVQSSLGREINRSAERVLDRLGIERQLTPEPPALACCGAMALHMGQRLAAQRQARPWIQRWDALLTRGKIQNIVVTTSGCGSVMKHFEDLFEPEDPDFAAARRVSQSVIDIAELLANVDWHVGSQPLGARVVYHDACSLKHGQRVTQPPRQLLRSLGFTVLEPGESHLCCGSAGTYNLLQPEIADRLGERKAKHLNQVEPDVIGAGNLGCLVQVARFGSAPIAHTVQLVDWATGGPPPHGLEAFEPRPTSQADNPPHSIVATPVASATTQADDSFW